MEKFEFLKEPFLKWYKQKIDYISSQKHMDFEENCKQICEFDDINMEKIDRCLLTILKEGINPDAIPFVFERFAHLYQKTSCFDVTPYFCEVSFNINNLPNNLNWLLVNIKELNFFSLDKLNIQMPYKQCHYCGRPYYYSHKTGKKFFNKKSKYCHNIECEHLKKTDGSNPLLHENCCFGKYAQSKKLLYQKMKAAKVPIEEKIKIFIHYCEQKLDENEKIQWTIQSKEKDAIFQDDWCEEEIITPSSYHYPKEKLDNILYGIDHPRNWRNFFNK